jgi:hypothetical protein
VAWSFYGPSSNYGAFVTLPFEFAVGSGVLVPTRVLSIPVTGLFSLFLPPGVLGAACLSPIIRVTTPAQPPSRKIYDPSAGSTFYPALEVRYVGISGEVTARFQVRDGIVRLPDLHWVIDSVGLPTNFATLGSASQNVAVGQGGAYATSFEVWAERGQSGSVELGGGFFSTDIPTSFAGFLLQCGAFYATY